MMSENSVPTAGAIGVGIDVAIVVFYEKRAYTRLPAELVEGLSLCQLSFPGGSSRVNW